MIELLASPSVCIVDDEPEDFGPIVGALNELFVGAVHLDGTIENLPNTPFDRLKLVFLDLHLSGSVGKDAASYTANAFTKIVSTETAPLIVVIWSKYAKDLVDTDGLPPNDQETEVELFKRTLIEAEPKYSERIVFVEMSKPSVEDRGSNWIKKLKAENGLLAEHNMIADDNFAAVRHANKLNYITSLN